MGSTSYYVVCSEKTPLYEMDNVRIFEWAPLIKKILILLLNLASPIIFDGQISRIFGNPH